MSLITQCPACSTMFKVVPDQLRISDGWVRCGQCQKVFDAKAHLFTETSVPSVQTDADAASTTTSDALTDTASDPVSIAVGPDPVLVAQQDVSPVVMQASENAAVALDDFLSQSPKVLEHPPGVDPQTPPFEATRQQTPIFDLPAFSTPRYQQTEVLHLQPPDLEELSFMRHARRALFWRRWEVRLVLSVLALMLCVGLVVQIAYQERDRWAAYEPALAPSLEALCGVLSCTISPLRAIDALVIDSSSFTKVRSDVYRLQLTLKNTGPVALAPPAVELTLTDMQDQSVVRRVLQPSEMGFKNTLFAANTDFTVVLPIAVQSSDIAKDRVSGYRILAFYP